MIGMVLAAGLGKRLGHETAELPKTLLGVDGDRTILDIALANFAHVGLTDAVIVTGYAHDRLAERVPELERRHGLKGSGGTIESEHTVPDYHFRTLAELADAVDAGR